MWPRTSLAAIIVAVFAAALPSAQAAPPDNPCSLLSQAQVTAALGVAVGAPQRTTTVMNTCTWIQTGAGLVGGRSVQVILRTAADHDQNNALMNQASTMAKKNPPTVTPVSGLGDDAYYTTIGSQATLSVKKGNIGINFAIRAGDIPVDEIKSKEKTLASQILSNL